MIRNIYRSYVTSFTSRRTIPIYISMVTINKAVTCYRIKCLHETYMFRCLALPGNSLNSGNKSDTSLASRGKSWVCLISQCKSTSIYLQTTLKRKRLFSDINRCRKEITNAGTRYCYISQLTNGSIYQVFACVIWEFLLWFVLPNNKKLHRKNTVGSL